MNQSFLILLVTVVILGAALGGSFVGGVVYGRGQAATADTLPPGLNGSFAGGAEPVDVPAGAAPGPGNFDALPGAAGPFPEGQPPEFGGNRGGLTGTVASIDGSALSLTTPQGDTLVTLNDDTALTQIAPADRDELTAGAAVRISGRPNADGSIFQARSILIIPEGAANPFAGGNTNRRNRGQPRQ